MTDNTGKFFDQAAAFQKLWMDSITEMAGVWSQFSAGSPPVDEMRRMPQFLEMMKASLNGALDLKRMAREGMNRVHEQFENPSRQDVDDVLLAIRHVERRLLDRLEGLDDRVANLNQRIDNLDEGIAKQENAIERLEQTVKTKVQKPAARPRKETGA